MHDRIVIDSWVQTIYKNCNLMLFQNTLAGFLTSYPKLFDAPDFCLMHKALECLGTAGQIVVHETYQSGLMT